jgi:hypothetical protein
MMHQRNRFPIQGESGSGGGPADGGDGPVERAMDDLLRQLEREIAENSAEIATAEGEIRARRHPQAEERLGELHRRSNALIGKYVVSRRLRESTDFSTLMQALREVLESLVGLASFAVYWRESPEDDNLLLCTVEPEDSATSRAVRVGDGPVGAVAGLREPFVVRPEERKFTVPATPIGWFPLTREGQPRGGIAVFEVLSHKKGFEPRDLDLLDLLSTHAAYAIESVCAAARKDLAASTTAEVIARVGDGRKP